MHDERDTTALPPHPPPDPRPWASGPSFGFTRGKGSTTPHKCLQPLASHLTHYQPPMVELSDVRGWRSGVAAESSLCLGWWHDDRTAVAGCDGACSAASSLTCGEPWQSREVGTVLVKKRAGGVSWAGSRFVAPFPVHFERRAPLSLSPLSLFVRPSALGGPWGRWSMWHRRRQLSGCCSVNHECPGRL